MAAVSYSFSPNTKAQSGQVNSNFDQLANEILPTFVVTITGTLTTGTSLTPILIVPQDLLILKAYAAVKTAPVGANIIVDINVNGTSIWNTTQANRLNIVAGSDTGNSTTFDTTQLSDGGLLTFDLDQVGSTTSGADITIELRCEWR